MEINERIRENIIKHMGSKAEDFLSSIPVKIEKYTKKWQLTRVAFLEKEMAGLLFLCESDIYGECALKICIPDSEFKTGVDCIRAYDGKEYVKIHAYDLADHILLMENVIPGKQMWEIEDYCERARIFAETVKGLPILWDGHGNYPTYQVWMQDLRDTLVNLGDRDDVIFYLNKALAIYDELKLKYNRKCLLHGDLHQENMLLNSKGGYTIIDPKGVVDDPVMETARFLLNEVPCEVEKIRKIISIISAIIGIPEEDVTKSMFIDTALGQGWTFDKPFENQKDFAEQKQEALSICSFVYELLSY